MEIHYGAFLQQLFRILLLIGCANTQLGMIDLNAYNSFTNGFS